MLDALTFSIPELVDVAIVWLLVWAGIAWLRTSPARVALVGLAILGAVFLAARQLDLRLTTWILQAFFAVSVLVVVVVFQQELRRLFEQIASLGPFARRRAPTHLDAIDVLVRCLATLADQRRGALLVIPGRESLDLHLDGGVALDARLSEPLLLSLFDPHSPGHDGAVVLEGERVLRFAAHLPLSTDHVQLGQRGTRHAAALGLSERTDALCIVVSEERGTVSVARGGQLETLASAQLAGDRIRSFLRELQPAGAGGRRSWARVRAHWREGVAALPLAAFLWFLAVPGSGRIEAEREVPIRVTGLPEGYQLEEIEPTSATVRIAGRRRDLLLLGDDDLEVRVDVILVELGRRSFRLSPENVVHPENIDALSVDPPTVKISLRRNGEVPGEERPNP